MLNSSIELIRHDNRERTENISFCCSTFNSQFKTKFYGSISLSLSFAVDIKAVEERRETPHDVLNFFPQEKSRIGYALDSALMS